MDIQFAANPQFFKAFVKEHSTTSPIREMLVVGYVQFEKDRREGYEWRVLLFAGLDVTEDFGGYATEELAKASLFGMVFKSLNS